MPSVSSYAFTEAVSARYLASRPLIKKKAVAETEDSDAFYRREATVSPAAFLRQVSTGA
jgi:hypothetical protein